MKAKNINRSHHTRELADEVEALTAKVGEHLK